MKTSVDNIIAEKVFEATKNLSEEEKLNLWNNLKGKFKAGDNLTGSIFYKAHFGVYLDVSEPFPALLRIVDMKDLDYDKYQKDLIFKLGEEVELTYVWMSDQPDKIDVHQKGKKLS